MHCAHRVRLRPLPTGRSPRRRDKFGEWNKWYRRNIALAEERYSEYLKFIEGEGK
jgi:hypothetical protein